MQLTGNNTNSEMINDLLRDGKIGKALSLFHLPAGWPDWAIWLSSVLMALLSTAAWFAITGNQQSAVLAGAVFWLFSLGDILVLLSLPRKGVSFGPWKAQYFTLALPRTAATLLLGMVALAFGRPWGLTLLIVIHLAGTIAFLWGALVEPFRLGLTEMDLVTDRLPKGSSPIRLLHISDVHVERLTRREAEVLRLVERVKPDLIVLTGDYVNLSYNRDPETHRQVKQMLSQLSAPHGVYATLGSPPVDLPETVVPIFEELPIPLMREQWKQVKLDNERALVLVGMDCTHHIPTDAARLDRLMAAAPNGVPQILLYHSPELMPQAAEHEIDLYLCGHTHGGQVRLPIIGPILTSSQLGRKYVMGLYRDGRTHLYVSRGVGLEGLSAPRVRFLAPPELTLVTLKPA